MHPRRSLACLLVLALALLGFAGCGSDDSTSSSSDSTAAEAGPHRITAAITRDSVEELGLTEGVEATAFVKATSVMVERT